jgi:hypothetical protein
MKRKKIHFILNENKFHTIKFIVNYSFEYMPEFFFNILYDLNQNFIDFSGFILIALHFLTLFLATFCCHLMNENETYSSFN